MQKWEIAGISLLPMVELVMVLNDYLAGTMGDEVLLVPAAVILHAFAGVATVAAIVRAQMDRRKAADGGS